MIRNKIKQRKELIMASAFAIYTTSLFFLVHHIGYERGYSKAINDIVVKAPDGSIFNF